LEAFRREIPSGADTIVSRRTEPVDRQTKTVSMTDEPVPLMWIDPPISAGHGIAAEQASPASRIATMMGR
jgi:hypothetical protein